MENVFNIWVFKSVSQNVRFNSPRAVEKVCEELNCRTQCAVRGCRSAGKIAWNDFWVLTGCRSSEKHSLVVSTSLLASHLILSDSSYDEEEGWKPLKSTPFMPLQYFHSLKYVHKEGLIFPLDQCGNWGSKLISHSCDMSRPKTHFSTTVTTLT